MKTRLIGLKLGLTKRAGLEKLLTLLKSPIGKGIGIGAVTGGIGNSVREYLNNQGEENQLTKTLKGGLTGAGVGGVLGGSLGAVFNKLRNKIPTNVPEVKIPTHVSNLELDELIKNNPVSVVTRGYTRGLDYTNIGGFGNNYISHKVLDQLQRYTGTHGIIQGGSNKLGIILNKLNDKFHVYLTGIDLPWLSEASPGRISSNFNFHGLDEQTAKNLVQKFLNNPHEERKILGNLILRDQAFKGNNLATIVDLEKELGPAYDSFSKSLGYPQAEWGLKPQALQAYAAAPSVGLSKPTDISPFSDIADKFKTLDLSGSNGLKVVAGHAYDEKARQKILNEALLHQLH